MGTIFSCHEMNSGFIFSSPRAREQVAQQIRFVDQFDVIPVNNTTVYK